MLSPPPIEYWRSATGADLLKRAQELAEATNFDGATLALRIKSAAKSVGVTELNGVIDLVLARHKATARLGKWCQEAFLTCRSVEQASRPEIAGYRAQGFASSRHVLEIGTGAGFDTAHIAHVAHRVTTLEPDARLAEMARFNLALQGIENVEVRVSTAEDFLVSNDLNPFDGLYADPSRRDSTGARIRAAEDYLPPVGLIVAAPIKGVVGIKASPALDIALPEGWGRQFIGFAGECLEQTLWSGRPAPLPAVFLADTATPWFDTGACPALLAADELPSGYLLDPHPALVRAHAVGSFYAEHGLREIDPRSPYGLSSEPCMTPFGQPFRIIESFPFRLRDLKSRLEALRWTNRTEIKKRGVEEDPDQLRLKLKLPRQAHPTDPFGVVILARRGESILAILAERLRSGEE
jgi:hypothetical protein